MYLWAVMTGIEREKIKRHWHEKIEEINFLVKKVRKTL
jgi:hypothetical protein